MSPPEIWGPPIWTFYHTLCEQVNENVNPAVYKNIFTFIKRISSYLPCPDCSHDANIFFSKVNVNDITDKIKLKNTIYLFHNYVNNKKKKPLFNYSNLTIYNSKNIVQVINNFIKNYHTRGNMNQLTESFQRKMVIQDLKKWLFNNIQIFKNNNTINIQNTATNNSVNDTDKK